MKIHFTRDSQHTYHHHHPQSASIKLSEEALKSYIVERNVIIKADKMSTPHFCAYTLVVYPSEDIKGDPFDICEEGRDFMDGWIFFPLHL